MAKRGPPAVEPPQPDLHWGHGDHRVKKRVILSVISYPVFPVNPVEIFF
jgi:hypothetical protein